MTNKGKCTIGNCDNKRVYKLYCHKHQWRLRKYGTPHYCIDTKNTEVDFWSKVTKTDSCWLWENRWLDRDGYGFFRFEGKPHRVHRLSWYFTYGEWPKMDLLHSCDVANCVNPSHLREGTNKDNVDDKVSRNRQARGSKLPQSILSERQVINIKNRLKNNEPVDSIHEDYNFVSCQAIKDIKRGKNWKYI